METPPKSVPVTMTRAELLWLTVSTWLGGVFTLTILPMLLVPRLGIPVGMALSYLVFFIEWQPVQIITQRVLGTSSVVVRMLALVASAAVAAFYLRDFLAGAVAAN
jgi:hypothetical protein